MIFRVVDATQAMDVFFGPLSCLLQDLPHRPVEEQARVPHLQGAATAAGYPRRSPHRSHRETGVSAAVPRCANLQRGLNSIFPGPLTGIVQLHATLLKLFMALQTGELDPNGEVEYEPLQPMAQNAQPSRRNSGSQSKRKASGSTAAAHKFCGASNAEAAHSDAAAAELGAEAAPQRPQQQERPNAGQLAAEPVPWDTSRQSHAAYAFAAAGDGNGPPAAEDSAARPQEVRSFKRQKRQPKVDQPTLEPPKAEPPKPELPKTGQSKPEQPKATQTKAALQAQQLPARRPPKSAKQQLQDAARQHADTQGRRAPELKANNAAAAHPVALATAGNAASRSTAKHGSRRVSEPKVDPYEFHSSGSQPLAPQAVLVAPPGASTTGTADAAGPPALAGRPAARASGGAAKQARGAAPDQSAAGSAAASAHAGQSHSHSGRSQLSSQSAGRRIPGRLVPWSCGACTFENPVRCPSVLPWLLKVLV